MYNPYMVVYGEILFMENTIIGAVLLYLTGEICRQSLRGPGLISGSIMCGAFSLVIFLGAKGAAMVLMEVVFAVAVCTVAFGRKRKRGSRGCFSSKVCSALQWEKSIVFILVTYFMGGVVMGLLLLMDQQGIYTAAGIYTGEMKAAMLAVFICLGYMTVIQIIKTVRSRKLYEENSFHVVIDFGEGSIETRAFLDTGNHLKEPITGKPVAVASQELWLLIQRRGFAPEKGFDVMHGSSDAARRLALVPYETVGAKGLLEAVRTDSIEIEGKKIKGCYIAGSNGEFKMGSSHSNQYEEIEWELLLPAGIMEY